MKSSIHRFFEKQPLLSSVILFLIYLVASTAFGLAAKAWLPHFQPEFVALVVLALLVALTISYLGWWKETGFTPVSEWKPLPLVWIPLAVVIILPFLRGIKTSDSGTFFYLLVAYALTGFMEEGMMRGIIMRVLKPTGAVRSVLISALLFGLIHIGNLLYRSPIIVMAQMLGGFVHGIGLGAIRLRNNSIWFVILLHGLHDLFLKYTNFPAIPLDVVQVTLLMLYGIYLLRDKKALAEAG